ncbi:MAG TPA: hypothetical protein PL033_12045 [Candidatus Brocadiia bacterium]|nr:hypothetical protein [Candidatus Brocadiia bacterium]
MAVTIDDVINETKDFLTEGFQKHGRVRPTVYLFTSDSRLFPLPPTRGMGMMEVERRVAAFRRFCNMVQAEALLHFYLARVGNPEDVEADKDGADAARLHDRECLVLEIETRQEHYCFVWL